jgi:hypothetical protein
MEFRPAGTESRQVVMEVLAAGAQRILSTPHETGH